MQDQSGVAHRRNFLRLNLMILATTALGGLLRPGVAHAIQRPAPAGTPLLNADDPQAKAMNYTPDSSVAGQSCSNCQLYSGSSGSDWGPCAIFSYRTDPKTKMNFVVNADGWCQGWAPRAGGNT